MRTLTIAHATWREAIRQPVSIIILCVAAAVTFLSQYLNFYHLNEETGVNVIREMSVAQTLMCGIVIAVFTASAVLADEIESRTIVTLLAKPVRRYEVVLGKFLGIMMAISAAFAVLVVISLCTAWWTEVDSSGPGGEPAFDKQRTNPAWAVTKLPWLTAGQGSVLAADCNGAVMSRRGGAEIDYLGSAGDLLLLSSGQGALLAGRVPLEVGPGGHASPGLATMALDAARFLRTRTAILFKAFVLAFVQVMVIAAVAIAVATRLPLIFNALICAAVFILGNVWYTLLVAWVGKNWAVHLLPNFQNLDLTGGLATGIDRVDPEVWAGGVLYGLIYTMLVLAVAVLLFRRREVA